MAVCLSGRRALRFDKVASLISEVRRMGWNGQELEAKAALRWEALSPVQVRLTRGRVEREEETK